MLAKKCRTGEVSRASGSTQRTVIEEDVVRGKVYDRHLFRRLMRYALPYWPWLAFGVVAIIVASALDVLGPYLTRLAVDRYILPGDTQGLFRIVLVYLGVILGAFAIRYAQIYATQYLGQKIIYDLRMDVYTHLQRMDQRYFDRNPVGRLMTRLTSDIEALNQMFTQGIVMIFGDIFLITGIVVFMLSLNTQLALWTFSVIPLLLVASFVFRKKVRIAYGKIRFHLAQINAFLQERISGMAIVQLFNRQKADFEQFRQLNWQYTRAFIRTIFYYALFYPVVEVLSAAALGIIIYRSGVMISAETVTLGTVISFIQYVRMFFRPISDLSEKYNVLQSAFASSERIFKLLDTRPEIQSPPNGYRTERIQKGIEFRDVWFAYDGEDWVLRDIQLTIPAGQRYALVGHTGSGKSTLVRPIGRFYDVQRGTVLVDGVPVQEWDLADLRRHMAIVLQDVFLFSGTILDNIRLGRTDIPESAVIEAAKKVNAHSFIERLPGGYLAEVKERGANLSTGQKQLISLARAIVMNPDILILDEATANVDSESELLIQQALQTVLKDRTAIVIAHRLSTIQHMDQIVVLHKGRIREMGTHQQLLAARGLYYKLYLLQYQQRPTPSSATIGHATQR